jgi:chaperonin GroEL
MIIDTHPRIVLYGNDAREALIKGANAVANAVKVTLGPHGRHVIIDRTKKQASIRITKDGVSVAKEINPANLAENTGAQIFKKAAISAVEKAGDGTTTATVLAQYLLNDGFDYIKNGSNPMDIVRGMKFALNELVGSIRRVAVPVKTIEELRNVARISCNNDSELGDIVAEVLHTVTEDGNVIIEESATSKTSYTITAGMKFDTGIAETSRYFVTDSEKMQWVKDDCAIVLVEDVISNIEQLKHLVNGAAGRPILVIAKDYDEMFLANAVNLFLRGQINMCFVKASGYGDLRRARLQDIAMFTGGEVIAPQSVYSLESPNIYTQVAGIARRVVVTENSVMILEGGAALDNGDYRARYDAHVVYLKQLLENTEDEYDKDNLRKRVGTLVGGTAVIRVGGFTEEQIGERKDRVDDAVNAVRCAMKEGIVAGGGVTLMNPTNWPEFSAFSEAENEDFMRGYNLVFGSLSEPFKTILSNAGIPYEEVTNKILGNSSTTAGYDARNFKYVDCMITAGIIDPALVVITALDSAVNVAAIMLTTDTLINYDIS